MDSNDIDAVDYAVLKCLDENGATWKKQIHAWMKDNADELPNVSTKSVQTIGRRADRLHDAGLIESCIMSPDTVNRDMIIGYKLTPDGEAIFREKRDAFLREMVIQSADSLLTADAADTPSVSVERGPLVRLMVDAFDIDERTCKEVLPQIGTEELLGLLASHFFLDNAGDTFDAENTETLVTLLERTPAFRHPFEKKNFIARLREKVAARISPASEPARSPVRDEPRPGQQAAETDA